MELQHTAPNTPRDDSTISWRSTAVYLELPTPGDLAGRKQQRVGQHGIQTGFPCAGSVLRRYAGERNRADPTYGEERTAPPPVRGGIHLEDMMGALLEDKEVPIRLRFGDARIEANRPRPPRDPLTPPRQDNGDLTQRTYPKRRSSR